MFTGPYQSSGVINVFLMNLMFSDIKTLRLLETDVLLQGV